MALITFRDVEKHFGDKLLFRDLSFRIESGAHVAFRAPSGGGKTTLLRLILGFETPDAGEILYQDRRLTPVAVAELRRRTAYVPQLVDWGMGRVEDLLAGFMAFRANAHLTGWRDELESLLPFFRLETRILQRDFHQLSGGEKQRLGLALAILLKRSIFLLDEPTASLDATLVHKVVDYFRGRADATILVASHRLDWIEMGQFRLLKVP